LKIKITENQLDTISKNLNDEELSMMDDRATQRKDVFTKSTVADKKAF
jgi:hypothetical protein